MCDVGSSTFVGDNIVSEGGDYVNSADERQEDDVDLNYRVDGMDDIGVVSFDSLTAEELYKFHFADNLLAYEFYNTYGMVRGFSVRKSKLGRNVKGAVVRQHFVCSSQGFRDPIESDNRVREEKALTRCGCKATMRVRVNESGRWHVTYFNDEHNHMLMGGKFVGQLRSHRKMKHADLAQMHSLLRVGVSTPHIYGSFADQSGGFDKVGFRKRDMYNQIHKERNTKEGDTDKAFGYLEGLASSDPAMYWAHTVCSDGRLQKLFWCDGPSRFDYEIFGDVLAFDATYGRNKYKCPLVVFSGVNHHNHTIIFASAVVTDETEETYVWILDQLMIAMKGKTPNAVITDGDMAMRNAIRRVFPNAHHRLCAWHLIRNATTNVGSKKFTQMFRNVMMGDYDLGEFQSRWNSMVVECGVLDHKWVKEIYEKKEMWAASYMRGKFFAGFRTTSRCESLHAQLGRFVQNKHDLIELLQHFQRALNSFRNSEVEADFKSLYGVPVLKTTMEDLEKDATNVYTREIFYMCRIYMMKAGKMKVVACKETPSYAIYTVNNYRQQSKSWRVSFDAEDGQIKCCCQRTETYGVPCAHIFAVLFFLDIGELPKCVVLNRWTKTAKQADEMSMAESNLGGALIYSRMGGLMGCCRRLCDLASRNTDDYKCIREKVCNEIRVLEAKYEAESGPSTHASEDVIKDPVPVRSKGCGGSTAKATPSRRN